MRDRRPARPGDDGFTLLELLVGLFVLGLLLALLTQGVRFGLQATQLQARAMDRNGDLHAIDRALRRLVAQADPGIYPEPASMRGTSQAVSFVTELPRSLAGAVQRADVVLLAEGGRLLLRWTPHRHVLLSGSAPAWQDTVLLDGVERIELAYQPAGATGTWRPSWIAGKLPSLIRVRIVFGQDGGRRWPPILVAPLREAIEE